MSRFFLFIVFSFGLHLAFGAVLISGQSAGFLNKGFEASLDDSAAALVETDSRQKGQVLDQNPSKPVASAPRPSLKKVKKAVKKPVLTSFKKADQKADQKSIKNSLQKPAEVQIKNPPPPPSLPAEVKEVKKIIEVKEAQKIKTAKETKDKQLPLSKAAPAVKPPVLSPPVQAAVSPPPQKAAPPVPAKPSSLPADEIWVDEEDFITPPSSAKSPAPPKETITKSPPPAAAPMLKPPAQAPDLKGLPPAKDYSHLKQKPGNPVPQYPEEALRQKWEGRVDLVYYVNSAGLVEKIHVNRSSGYSVLDNEAIRTLARYYYDPGQAGWVKHPVQFVLNKNVEVKEAAVLRVSPLAAP